MFYHYSRPRKAGSRPVPASDRLRDRVPQVMDQIRQGALDSSIVGQDTVAGHACGVVEVASRDPAQRAAPPLLD